ncbi:hypothetical protein OUZ56_033814 [Daphnia magna]|uniref:Uncharacterized protein n=1 Tax=Daphnia magna TaxID=35525 RepID=A0ABR0BB55_9CRUS|nr:hypothetical protein OUZ56_033814 [Daphnia magna]
MVGGSYGGRRNREYVRCKDYRLGHLFPIAIVTTEEQQLILPDLFVSKAIEHKMYVDDYLSSAKTIHLAIQEATGVQEALAAGDLHPKDGSQIPLSSSTCCPSTSKLVS